MSDRPLHEVLRELRERQGVSLRQAARELGVDAAHLSRIERGRKRPSDALARRAATYYAVDASAFSPPKTDLPADVVDILRSNPDIVEELRERYGSR
jgi:transcriptional regulator with XRE-family HTH domain